MSVFPDKEKDETTWFLYLSYTITHHVATVNEWLSWVKQFSTSHAFKITAMKILVCYKTVCCLYFSDHMCIVQAEDRVFYVTILLSGNLILHSLRFHCHFQMFNEATYGYEMPLLFLLPRFYHFQSQNFWINGNVVTSSVLHFLSKTTTGGDEKCWRRRQCMFKSPVFPHCLCGRT